MYSIHISIDIKKIHQNLRVFNYDFLKVKQNLGIFKK